MSTMSTIINVNDILTRAGITLSDNGNMMFAEQNIGNSSERNLEFDNSASGESISKILNSETWQDHN